MNARATLRSTLPSILLKSLWNACSFQDLHTNVRSLMWGIGIHKYPISWWRPAILKFLRRYDLLRAFGLQKLEAWVREGKIARETGDGMSGLASNEGENEVGSKEKEEERQEKTKDGGKRKQERKEQKFGYEIPPKKAQG